MTQILGKGMGGLVTKNTSQVNRLEKEKQDYLFCLGAASKFSPREGVLLVEDDSLPGITLYQGFPLLNPFLVQ